MAGSLDITKAIQKQLTVKIGEVLTVATREWTNEIGKNLDKFIQGCIGNFRRLEQSYWNNLGQGQGEKKYGRGKNVSLNGETRVLSSNLHKFTSVSGEMKNYTGYVIFYNNHIITSRNRLLRKMVSPPTYVLNGKVKSYDLPLDNAVGYGVSKRGGIHRSFRTQKRRGKDDRRKSFTDVHLSIAVFADSEHAFFVDNPYPQKRSPFTQGTGWFRMYCKTIAGYWMNNVVDAINFYMRDTGNRLKELAGSNSALGKEMFISNWVKTENFSNDALTSKITEKRMWSPKTLQATRIISDKYVKVNGKYTRRTIATLSFKNKGISLDIPIIVTGQRRTKRDAVLWNRNHAKI